MKQPTTFTYTTAANKRILRLQSHASTTRGGGRFRCGAFEPYRAMLDASCRRLKVVGDVALAATMLPSRFPSILDPDQGTAIYSTCTQKSIIPGKTMCVTSVE